jgi:predicted DNA-binding transcriptional regulator YafY
MKGVTTPPAGVPTLGLAEAAKACGVSVSTLRRKRPDLEAHGAAQTATGWRIPVTALIALGLMSNTTDAPTEPPSPRYAPDTLDALQARLDAQQTELDSARERRDALRSQLAAAEQRAAVAEAIAAERERVIQTQAMALRMLEAPKTPATPMPPAPTEPAESPSPAPSKEDHKHAPKRAWWPFR